MRFVIAFTLTAVSTLCLADTIKMPGGQTRKGVYVTTDKNNYYVRSRDGTTEIVNLRRADPKSVTYATQDEREEILRAWEQNQKPEATQEPQAVPDVEDHQDAQPVKAISVKRPYDPELYARRDAFLASKAARDARDREQKAEMKARMAEAQARADEAAALRDQTNAFRAADRRRTLNIEGLKRIATMPVPSHDDFYTLSLQQDQTRALQDISRKLNDNGTRLGPSPGDYLQEQQTRALDRIGSKLEDLTSRVPLR